MKNLLGCGFMLFSSLLLAAPTLPKNCHAVAVQGETVTIESKKHSVFFVHNLSNADLWITHPVSTPGADAAWSSRLQADNWSALVLKKGGFVLNCIESRPGHEQQIPCEAAIAVCQWKRVKIPVARLEEYWAAEDLSVSALVAALGAKGFQGLS